MRGLRRGEAWGGPRPPRRGTARSTASRTRALVCRGTCASRGSRPTGRSSRAPRSPPVSARVRPRSGRAPLSSQHPAGLMAPPQLDRLRSDHRDLAVCHRASRGPATGRARERSYAPITRGGNASEKLVPRGGMLLRKSLRQGGKFLRADMYRKPRARASSAEAVVAAAPHAGASMAAPGRKRYRLCHANRASPRARARLQSAISLGSSHSYASALTRVSARAHS